MLVQQWGQDPIVKHLPQSVAVETGQRVRPQVTDVVSAELRQRYAEREGRYDPQLHKRLEPGLEKFGRDFPAVEIEQGDLTARYFPSAIRQTDVPLEEINAIGLSGRSGAAVWTEVIEQRFKSDLIRQS